MENWAGAAVVSAPGDPLVLLLEVRQLGNGSWRYTYSFAPGRACHIVTWPGPGMLSPYDDTFAQLAGDIGKRYPDSAR